MAEKKIPCGGFCYDTSQIKFVKVDGKDVMKIIIPTGGGGGAIVGNFYPMSDDDKATMDLDLDAHNIKNAGCISTNGAHPVHFGATVFSKGTSGVKLTSTNNDELAVVKPETIDTYVPINVGSPTGNSHAATRRFVEEAVDSLETTLTQEIALLKAKVAELEKNHPKP